MDKKRDLDVIVFLEPSYIDGKCYAHHVKSITVFAVNMLRGKGYYFMKKEPFSFISLSRLIHLFSDFRTLIFYNAPAQCELLEQLNIFNPNDRRFKIKVIDLMTMYSEQAEVLPDWVTCEDDPNRRADKEEAFYYGGYSYKWQKLKTATADYGYKKQDKYKMENPIHVVEATRFFI